MVVQLDPNNFEAWYDYGDTLFAMGYMKEGLKALNRSIELNPNFAESFYSRAKVLFAMEKNLDAVESLKIALKLNPELKTKFEIEFKGVKSVKEFASVLLQ
jgi:tetratricopeptide (TPR) repeat protein